MLKTIEHHKERVILRAIAPRTQWKPDEKPDARSLAKARRRRDR